MNGQPVEADPAALGSTANAALYTLLMPWKLLDPGTNLRYEGIVKLPDGTEAHAIAATYDPAASENHSTQDVWGYYFATDDHRYLAGMVDHGDYFAYIKNEKTVQAGGLLFNAYRASHRADAQRNLRWKRGDFFYENIVVK